MIIKGPSIYSMTLVIYILLAEGRCVASEKKIWKKN